MVCNKSKTQVGRVHQRECTSGESLTQQADIQRLRVDVCLDVPQKPMTLRGQKRADRRTDQGRVSAEEKGQ